MKLKLREVKEPDMTAHQWQICPPPASTTPRMLVFVLLTTPPLCLSACPFFTFKQLVSFLPCPQCWWSPDTLPLCLSLHVEQSGLPLNFLHKSWFSQLSTDTQTWGPDRASEHGFPGVHPHQGLDMLLVVLCITKSVSVSLWMST